MTVKEIRHIRVEDWNGNIYYPDFAKNGSGMGFIVDAIDVNTDNTNIPFSEGTSTDDAFANNHNCIIISSGGSKKKILVAEVPDLPFGNVSINFRMKSSLPKSKLQTMEVKTYYKDNSSKQSTTTLLDTIIITSEYFETGKYTNIPIITNYNGIDTGETSLLIEAYILAGTGETFSFDMMAVSMEMASQPDSKKNKIDVDKDTNTLVIP